MTTARRTAKRGQQPDSVGRPLLIDMGLIIVILLVFAQTLDFDFAKVDDTFYVEKNAHVLGGVSPTNVAWAFRSFEESNWHPLTWVSLMIDATIGRGRPWAFHATNLALHCANALLLFHLLFTTTRSAMKSAFVAAMFAIHPLHVESVAWVTERKDVLSTFFWFLAMLAHVAYARRPRAWRYAVVAVLFTLGAMSKPMVISLPLTLLLLDIWPLERLGPLSVSAFRGWTPITEKAPLFVLSAALGAVTLIANDRSDRRLRDLRGKDGLAFRSFDPLRLRGPDSWLEDRGVRSRPGGGDVARDRRAHSAPLSDGRVVLVRVDAHPGDRFR